MMCLKKCSFFLKIATLWAFPMGNFVFNMISKNARCKPGHEVHLQYAHIMHVYKYYNFHCRPGIFNLKPEIKNLSQSAQNL